MIGLWDAVVTFALLILLWILAVLWALLDAVVWWFWMRGCLVGCFMFGVIWYVNNVGLISFYDFIVLIY